MLQTAVSADKQVEAEFNKRKDTNNRRAASSGLLFLKGGHKLWSSALTALNKRSLSDFALIVVELSSTQQKKNLI
ncbi:hypothetical protein [Paenibacillus periandrae]|uniref:hypothetical protein n=1 Tax=Paenibacillus periandrae TaxID=1761741 RepID=UPI001F09BE3C|nr:hypothetical protein [Paenibacillus periandrae]